MKRIVIVTLSLFVVFFSGNFLSLASQYDPEIYQAQKILRTLGYKPGNPNGLWGDKTYRALINFQKDNDLSPTGQLDEIAKALLNSAFIVALGSKAEPTPSKDDIDFERMKETLNKKRREIDRLKIEVELKRLEDERINLEAEKQNLDKVDLKPELKQPSQSRTADTVDKGERYIKSFNGVILDTQKNLEWFIGPDKDTTWQEAKDWAKRLSVDGGNWRVPTIDELRVLYQTAVGDDNMTPLLKSGACWVWSSEERDSLTAWFFDFSEGKKKWFNRNSRKYKRALSIRQKM
jgi:hypothetical protein